DAVIAAAKGTGLLVEVLDLDELTAGGYGGGVAGGPGAGGARGAGEAGGGASRKRVALVGKGITFDTGGISIKPTAGMWEMKSDMAGAAAVGAAMLAVAALKPAVAGTGSLRLGQNTPSRTA